MNIAHVHLSDEFAGSEQYAASLAALQAGAGHNVCVIIRQGPQVPRWRAEAAPATVVVVPGWVPSVAEGWVLRKLLKGFAPHMVHAHLGRANCKAGWAAHALGVPWVASIHLRYKAKEMANADGLICIARWQEQDVAMEGFAKPVATIWNWLPHGDDVPTGGHTLRDGLGIPDDAFVFGSAGRLHQQKGLDILIKAFRQAFFDDENVRLLIAGQGEERLRLQGLAGNDKRIIFAGYQQDMAPFYATCDVYVSASRYEPFGLTVLEAMAHRKPLICTETEGPKEFLAGQPGVTWVPLKEEGAMADALFAAYSRQEGQRRGPMAYDMAPFAPERALADVMAFYGTVQEAFKKA